MSCVCGSEFCYACGDPYPCGRDGDGCPRVRAGIQRTRPTIARNLEALLERRRQRRLAFLMGSRCSESLVCKLPPDVLRRIAEELS